MDFILIKTAICGVLSLVIFGLLQKKTIAIWNNTTLIISWIAFRIVPFIVVFFILKYVPTSDIEGFYYLGKHAYRGELAHRDFINIYSPLFPYFIGGALKIWYDLRSIIALMIVLELVALYFTLSFFRTQKDRFFHAILYLALPSSLVLCVIGGQEDIWLWLFGTAAFVVARRFGEVGMGLVIVLGLLCTKVIGILFLLPLLILVKRPFPLFITLAVGGGVVLALLYGLVGLEFMQPLREADTLRAPNILSVLNPWVFNSIGVGKGFWNWAGLGITTGVGCWVAFRVKHLPFEEAFSRMWVGVYATMMIVQQSAYANYIFLFLPPLVFSIIRWKNTKEVIIFLIFNALCTVHPSLWWRLANPKYLQPSDIWASPMALLDYTLQIGIVLGTAYFIHKAATFRSVQT